MNWGEFDGVDVALIICKHGRIYYIQIQGPCIVAAIYGRDSK